jgi:hypothetical protein
MVASLAERRSAAQHVLSTLGYTPELWVEQFPVWLGGESSVRADIVAFSRASPQDMSTATVVVEIKTSHSNHSAVQRSVAEIARALAAPILLNVGDTEVSLFAVQTTGEPRLIQEVTYEDLDSMGGYEDRLGPVALMESKLGRGQLSLLPLDFALFNYAKQRTERLLTPRVEAALAAAVEISSPTLLEIKGSVPAERQHQQAARLVVGALTALVLRDKEDLQDLRPGALMDASQQRYSQYFGWMQSATAVELRGFEVLIRTLGEGINYRSLDPRLLSKIYETTLVTDVQRRQLGTHYTPPSLAHQMLETLPIEYVRPEDRQVLDPTCGSGGLLLAAHDRLQDLQPRSWDLDISHANLAQSLRGFDADAFAVELARLSLLLHALPAGNGWQVQQANVLAQRLHRDSRPNIIVANPPWRNTNVGGSRRETADDFLGWMLKTLRPGGLISVVLPVGWLNSRTSRDARDELTRKCDLFEIWRLPESTFENASMAPAVIFARKNQRGQLSAGGRLLKRVINTSALDEFYRTGRAEESFFIAPNEIRELGMLAGPVTSALEGRSEVDVLSHFAKVVTGPQPKSGFQPRPADDPDAVPYLRTARSVRAFGAVSSGEVLNVRFPDDFQFASRRGWEGLGRAKVVVSAARSAQNPWRLKPLLDEDGILVRNSLQMIIPHDEESSRDALLGLLAVLGSAFVASWIDESVSDRNISTADLSRLPVPEDIVDPDLVRFGGLLHKGFTDPTLGRELDALMWRLMKVPEDVVEHVERRLSGFNAPEGRPRYGSLENARVPTGEETNLRRRKRWGVTRLDESRGVILDIPGAGEYQIRSAAIPPEMTGWMLRPDSSFSVLIAPGEGIQTAKFRYQDRSWMSDDEVNVATRTDVVRTGDG